MALVMALFIMVIVLLVAIALLDNATYSANDALSVQTKNQTFDAAEAGLNVAQWQLNENNNIASGSTATCANAINGYTCTWEVVLNRLHTAGGSVTDPDPQQPNTINVASGEALIAGWASSILGGRTVYVEQIVALGPPTILPNGAITCGQTGQISHQQITDISGHHGANIRCGTIIANGGGQIPDGNSYASGTTNQIIGFDGFAHIDQPPPTFLTPGQLAAIQTSTLTQAQSGPPNFYTSGNITSGAIGTSGSNCVAYIGGNITVNGSHNLTNYCVTTVVMGNVSVSGNATYQALPVSTTHMMYVFGTSGVILQGTPTTVGIVYSANGDVTINGGGYNSFTGSIITPHNVTLNGGGIANIYYNGNQTPPPVPNPNVVPQAQWEY
jgi:hypothetical protein